MSPPLPSRLLNSPQTVVSEAIDGLVACTPFLRRLQGADGVRPPPARRLPATAAGAAAPAAAAASAAAAPVATA
jgi:hypothetical protein